MGTIKISKYLSQAGIASRRKAETLVAQGLVFINGKAVTNTAARIDPENDQVCFKGKPVKTAAHVYYLLNKPLGYISTTSDTHARQLITALVPQIPKVWPVGRLDKFTSGLIILTNDGELTQKITHPRHQVEKEYFFTTNHPLSGEDINRLRRGANLEDGPIKPDLLEPAGGGYRIVIHSGKKRVVRRMVESTGKRVATLERVRIAFLRLGNLAPGKWRRLNAGELARLSGKTRQLR